MPSNNIWLEVRKDNGAILSYFLEKPQAPSATVDYVQATTDELLYLNSLEDFILPAGMVATLDDLQAHRERLQAAKKKSLTLPAGSNKKPSQKPPHSIAGATDNKQRATKKLSKAEFMSGFKKVDKPNKQGNE
ncbi:hypothetical protein AL532_14845 [Pseudomonas monteilii]|uniref:hypothetical protein n=1 Tax=Pseudomonas monteilii TaxID=76759 RepID=UPI000CEB5FB3|nr:hypothetical protein [Pseudomonas monteilii]AVH37524.1 hypothetical protein AL532_14845 [Pseudomonas monteilii]